MSHKKCAKILGVVLFLFGFLSCLPGFTTDMLFLGIFHVNTAANALHVLTGVVGYGVSHLGSKASKVFFQIFGLIYGTIAVLGFGYGEMDVLGYIANNMADTWFHLALALLSLYLGFLYKNVKQHA